MPDRTELEIQELREEIRRLKESPANGNAHAEAPPPSPPPAQEPAAPPEGFVGFLRANPIKIVIGLAVLAAAAIGGMFLWRYLNSYESTDDAHVDGHVNSVTPRIAGTIAKVFAVENQAVKKGDLLIELDPSDLNVALERAQANLQQAQASTVAQQTGVPITSISTETGIETARSEVLNAEAGLAAAERERDVEMARLGEAQANDGKAKADVARYGQLIAKDEVSREEYEQRVVTAQASAARVAAQQAAVAGAKKAIEQRAAAVEQARSRLNQATRNAPQQVIAQRAGVAVQRAAAEALRAGLNEASLNLQYTKILAPVDGIVGRRAAEVGQRVQPGQQLLSVVQTGDVWVTANFKESQLRRMRAGQPAAIHVDAFNRDFDGYVESMPAASSATFSVLPPENATGNYVKVVQRLPVRLRFKPHQDSLKELRPGMSVEPKVWLK